MITVSYTIENDINNCSNEDGRDGSKFKNYSFTITRLAVHEKYPLDRARQARPTPSLEDLRSALSAAKENTNVKKVLIPMLG